MDEDLAQEQEQEACDEPVIDEAALAALEQQACEAWAFTRPFDAPKPAAPAKTPQGKALPPVAKPGQVRAPAPWHQGPKSMTNASSPRPAGPGKAVQPSALANQKRPLTASAVDDNAIAKRPKAPVGSPVAAGKAPGARAPSDGGERAQAAVEAKAAGGAAAAPANNKVRLHAEVANKLKLLSAEGIKFAHAAVFAIAKTDKNKALAVLQALTKEDPTPKDPS